MTFFKFPSTGARHRKLINFFIIKNESMDFIQQERKLLYFVDDNARSMRECLGSFTEQTRLSRHSG